MNIVFDGNYLIHKCFSVWATYYQDRKATPEENDEAIRLALEDKEKQQVLLRKILIDFCAAVNRFKPLGIDSVVVVLDSMSWRYNFYPNYKYALTKVKSSYYQGFLNIINIFEEFLRKKGIIVSRVQGAEGDDLIYTWSVYFNETQEEEVIVITADSDLRQIINPKLSIFCNNSKNLRMYCHGCNEVRWNEYFDVDVLVDKVEPLEIVLYKVIMGDNSDNIPKLKKGFGNVAFGKFIKSITPYWIAEHVTVLEMGQIIAKWFCNFLNITDLQEYADMLGKILFNLQMTWLNLSVYNADNFLYENGKSLLENMLQDVSDQCDKYSYNKDYSLEELYGLMIK